MARAAIQAGYSPHAVREWLTVVFERVAPPAWGMVWRVALDDDGRFSVITSDGRVSGDSIDMAGADGLDIIAAIRAGARSLPPPPDPVTFLVAFYNANRDATNDEAKAAVMERFELSNRQFERILPIARIAAGLPWEGEPGRRRKKPAD